MTPLFGGLLLNCRPDRCLKRGGPFLADSGPFVQAGNLFPALGSGLGISKFMILHFA